MELLIKLSYNINVIYHKITFDIKLFLNLCILYPNRYIFSLAIRFVCSLAAQCHG